MDNTGFIPRFKRRYIGDRAFYASVVRLALPMVAQMAMANFVNLLDNVMVGALSTEAISGVAIVNQLVFVFNLTLFGLLAGSSIYGAQYAGNGDHAGVRHTFRFKLMSGVSLALIAWSVYSLMGDMLIGLYLNDVGGGVSLALTRAEALDYLVVAVWGLVPFAVSQSLGSTLKETGETVTPVRASIVAILTNLVLNYVLIYGKLGAPALGVRGAAIATVISRYAEVAVLFLAVYLKKERYPFINGALTSMRVPLALVKRIAVTGAPLLINELLWSVGQATIQQCYSVRGLETVASINIAGTVWQLFAVIMFAMGNAISIMVGQKLGSGDIEGAKETDRRLIFLSIAVHVAIGLLLVSVSGLVPRIYNVIPEVREMASKMLIVAGAALPLHSFTHAAYFTLRSGGRTIITFLFDSGFSWAVTVPAAFLLCYRTDAPIVLIYFLMQFSDALKIAFAVPLLRSGTWARNVIARVKSEPGGQ